MSHPKSAPHELRGNLCWDQHGNLPGEGDSAYWATRTLVIDALDGSETGIPLEIDGESWDVSVGYQKGGLKPRPSDDVNSLYEFRINAYGEGERKLPLLIQPQLDWDDEHRPQSVPKQLGLATNVKIETAVNLEPEEIESLIPKVMAALADYAGVDWNSQYFTGTPHQFSNITQYERYYRVEREQARKIVRTDGIFHRLFYLLADREGSKIVYSADNTEVIGYNHQIRLDREAANELIPQGQQHGKQFKHYHPEYVREEDDDGDPLYHPKLGALFKKAWNDNQSVPWHKHRDLTQELEENLVNLLQWANIPTHSGGPTYVPDDHFAVEDSDCDIAFWDDPTPEIEHNQDSVLVSTLSQLADRDRDVLEQVAMTDGGSTDVAEIEQEIGWATSTIYRALEHLDNLLEKDNGTVSFISEKIKQRVREVVEVTERAVEAQARIVETVLNVDPRDLERKGRAFQNWLNRYGGEIVQDLEVDEPGRIRIRTLLSRMKAPSNTEWAPEIVKYGQIAWKKTGRNTAAFENARIVFENHNGETVNVPARNLLRQYRTSG